jgi:hypothetical protein
MSSAIPSADSISNLAAAQQSLSAAEQAYDNWQTEHKQNEAELKTLLARQAALNEEKHKMEHDVAEGKRHLYEMWMAIGPPALPASPSPPTSAKRLTAAQKAAMTPEERKAHKAAKKLAHDERKAHRTPEEQAKIDAKVAKMLAALAASRAAKKAVAEEMPPSETPA